MIRRHYSTKFEKRWDMALTVGYIGAMMLFAGVVTVCAVVLIFGWPGGGMR